MRILIFVVVLVLASCSAQNTEFDRGLVDKKLKDRLANFERRIVVDCRNRILEEAVIHVDSIISEEYKLQHLNGVNLPDRPVRPTLPEGIILNDSTEIRPTF